MKRETFEVGGTLFLAEFIHPVQFDDGDAKVKNENKWRLSKASYHKSTWMRPLKRKQAQQIPRWKSIGYFDSLEAAKEAAKKSSE